MGTGWALGFVTKDKVFQEVWLRSFSRLSYGHPPAAISIPSPTWSDSVRFKITQWNQKDCVEHICLYV